MSWSSTEAMWNSMEYPGYRLEWVWYSEYSIITHTTLHILDTAIQDTAKNDVNVKFRWKVTQVSRIPIKLPVHANTTGDFLMRKGSRKEQSDAIKNVYLKNHNHNNHNNSAVHATPTLTFHLVFSL